MRTQPRGPTPPGQVCAAPVFHQTQRNMKMMQQLHSGSARLLKTRTTTRKTRAKRRLRQRRRRGFASRSVPPAASCQLAPVASPGPHATGCSWSVTAAAEPLPIATKPSPLDSMVWDATKPSLDSRVRDATKPPPLDQYTSPSSCQCMPGTNHTSMTSGRAVLEPSLAWSQASSVALSPSAALSPHPLRLDFTVDLTDFDLFDRKPTGRCWPH